MRHHKAVRLGLAFLCLSSFPAFTPSALAQYTAGRINFTPTPYPNADLQTISGLHPGLAFSQADLQTAAQHLSDTGAFDDIQITLDGPVKSISVNFKLKPADPDHILKVSFANLIWWQPGELRDALHAKLPLYNGTIPEAGNQQDAARAALQQLLAEKGINATLTHTLLDPIPGQSQHILEFRITSPEIRLHSASVAGASPNFAPAIDKVIAEAKGKLYDEGLTPTGIPQKILSIYRNAGRLDASLTHLNRTPQTSSGVIETDLAATVQEGQPYRISSIAFAGTPLMSSADFARTLTLHPEDIASDKALQLSLKPLSEAYRNQGYLDATIDAAPTLDQATRHVAYTITVTPREQYKVRSTTPLNLTPDQLADFNRAWKLQPGEIYNEGYVQNFLANNTALLTLAGYTASFKTVADLNDHVVDIYMSFTKGHPSAH